MLKALVIKELRELAGIVVLAALAAALLVTSLAGLPILPIAGIVGTGGFPFVNDGFTMYLSLILGGFAIALGLKQTAWESAYNTYYFLLHRPASRKFIFGAKLAVGSVLVVALGGLTILAYATWAAGTGNSPTPFFWSMTLPAWQLLVAVLLVYLGAFLSGIRPARWFGTRLAPLVSGIVLAMLVFGSAWWWLAATLMGLFVAISLAATFRYITTRDY